MPTPLSPGALFAGHRILRHLGASPTADVYEVLTSDGAHRALKICAVADPASSVIPSKPNARTLQEGEALTLIVHPNVVRLHAAGRDEDRVWLLLELVEGVTLADKLSSTSPRPPLEDILSWIQQAAEGLAEAHRANVVHRDVAPSNILVTPGGAVKVIDFGVAKLKWGVQTTAEQRLGTAMYMSPEAARGAEASARMDVYALGLVAYEAVAGTHAMGSTPRNMISIVSWHLHGQPRPLREVAPHVPPSLERLVHAAIEKDPARRLPDMRVLADGLRDVQSDLRAPLRRAARNVAPVSQDDGFAPTLTMPVFDDAPSTSEAPSTSASSSMRGGTVSMAAYGSSSTPPTERSAAVPTAAPAPPATAASSDRAALIPLPAPTSAAPHTSQPAPRSATAPASTAPTQRSPAVPEPPAERRSTGVPVESSVTRPSTTAPKRAPLVAFGIAAVLLVAAGLWATLARVLAPSPAAPLSPPAPASALPPASAPPPAVTPPAGATASAKAPPSAAPPVRSPASRPPAPVAKPPRKPSPEPAPARNRVFDTER
jgi:serine/threonine-protein kinase